VISMNRNKVFASCLVFEIEAIHSLSHCFCLMRSAEVLHRTKKPKLGRNGFVVFLMLLLQLTFPRVNLKIDVFNGTSAGSIGLATLFGWMKSELFNMHGDIL